MVKILSPGVFSRLKITFILLDKESAPTGTSKGDLLKARNLKRYINQVNNYRYIIWIRASVGPKFVVFFYHFFFHITFHLNKVCMPLILYF